MGESSFRFQGGEARQNGREKFTWKGTILTNELGSKCPRDVFNNTGLNEEWIE